MWPLLSTELKETAASQPRTCTAKTHKYKTYISKHSLNIHAHNHKEVKIEKCNGPTGVWLNTPTVQYSLVQCGVACPKTRLSRVRCIPRSEIDSLTLMYNPASGFSAQWDVFFSINFRGHYFTACGSGLYFTGPRATSERIFKGI